MKHKHRHHQFTLNNQQLHIGITNLPLTINNYSIKIGYAYIIIEPKMKYKHRHHQFCLNNHQLQYSTK